MANEQNVTQRIAQVAEAVIMAAKEAENPVNTARSVQIMPRTGGPALKQPAKYQDL